MFKKILVLFFLILACSSKAQELNCAVTINSEKVSQTNQQIFKTLQKSLNDFVNSSKWTNRKFTAAERINCSMFITINEYDADNFVATIQVQSSRPVYNSSYETQLLNINDKQFSFRYQEYQPLFYNANSFQSNLVSVVAYYVYVILGVDGDSFKLRGGTDYFDEARKIVNLAQSSGYSGWNQSDGNQTRWALIDNVFSNTYREYRSIMYNYHRQGIDYMSEDPERAKKQVAANIRIFKNMHDRRQNSYLQQLFFDAKATEIQQIFSGGPSVKIDDLQQTLNTLAPVYGSVWSKIKF